MDGLGWVDGMGEWMVGWLDRWVGGRAGWRDAWRDVCRQEGMDGCRKEAVRSGWKEWESCRAVGGMLGRAGWYWDERECEGMG